MNLIDPSGYAAYPPHRDCPIRDWDCEAVTNVKSLKNAFLDSASRHNSIPGMDTNGFAALLASVIVSERRIGNVPPMTDSRNRLTQLAENLLADLGCIVSGHLLKDAWDQGDWERFRRYLTNQEIPQLATVGIGNVWLETASNVWNGKACGNPLLGEKCIDVQVSELQVKNVFGFNVDVNNPFGPQTVCGAAGTCASYQPTEVESYVILAHQLLSDKINIEYVAANLEAGARRATSKGIQPTAFNSASWHLKGVQSFGEINQIGWNPGGASYILDHVSNALEAMHLTSTWSLQNEHEYIYWKTEE